MTVVHAPTLSTDARPALTPFVHTWAALLTTWRRSGEPVTTAVNVAVDGDRLYVRSWETAGKIKRIRNRPEVRLAPATIRGRPTGPAVPMRARLLTGARSEHAGRLINRKHPVFQRLLVRSGHRLTGRRTVHLELVPDHGGEPGRP
jgi:PPOX class probable F420-dependent enzyme